MDGEAGTDRKRSRRPGAPRIRADGPVGARRGRGAASLAPSSGPWPGALVILLAAVAVGAAACNPFSAPSREEARAVVTTQEDRDVQIVTSREFTLSGGGDAGESPTVSELVEADTTVVRPPFDRTFDISATRRFFVRVEPTDTVSLQATLEVFIDGESLGRLQGDLQDGPLQDVFVSVEL